MDGLGCGDAIPRRLSRPAFDTRRMGCSVCSSTGALKQGGPSVAFMPSRHQHSPPEVHILPVPAHLLLGPALNHVGTLAVRIRA